MPEENQQLIAQLAHCNLDDVERLYNNGQISRETVAAYLKQWNATPGRFTQAVLWDGRVENFDPQEDKVSVNIYRGVFEEFGVRQ